MIIVTLSLLSNLAGRDLIVVLLVIAIVFFGARRLPDLARAIRRLPAAFRRGLKDEAPEAKSEPTRSSEDLNP